MPGHLVQDEPEALKERFLSEKPTPGPRVADFWARYQRVFSEDGLKRPDPDDLHYFANSPVGAYAGQMTVFNNEWKALGPDEGARRVAESVRYLLYGPADQPLEDRLTYLLQRDCAVGMKGWKEALLTKVLCIVQPDRFLPIVTYGSPGVGRRSIGSSRTRDSALPPCCRSTASSRVPSRSLPSAAG